MALKVIIPPGQTQITINGLHQWDYGRQLEIVAEGLPAMVEVHFAYKGMETAVVRSCKASGSSVIATIPDICLEQTAQITAWVYEFEEITDETTGELVRVRGKTILTVTLPIIPRALPQPSETIPEDVSDKYTEAVAAMNGLVEECRQLVDNVAGEVDEAVQNASNEIDEAVQNASNEIAEAMQNLSSVKPKLTPEGVTASAQLEYTVTETGLYLVLFRSAEAAFSHTPVASLILITDLEQDARGTSAYSCAPAEVSGGGWDFGSVHYVANETSAPARKHVLSVYHPKGNNQTSGHRAHLLALYKLADV